MIYNVRVKKLSDWNFKGFQGFMEKKFKKKKLIYIRAHKTILICPLRNIESLILKYDLIHLTHFSYRQDRFTYLDYLVPWLTVEDWSRRVSPKFFSIVY